MPSESDSEQKNFGGSDKLNSWMLALFAALAIAYIAYIIMVITYFVLESNSG